MALRAGDLAPDFTRASSTRETQGEFHLAGQKGKNVVILFYALDFTPVWQNELSAFQEALPEFAEVNAQVVGVCTDTVFSHIAFQKFLGGVNFPLVADRWPYATVAEAYGVYPPVKHTIAFANDRAVFIVDRNGKIAWSKVYELKEAPEPAEILDVLKNLP